MNHSRWDGCRGSQAVVFRYVAAGKRGGSGEQERDQNGHDA